MPRCGMEIVLGTWDFVLLVVGVVGLVLLLVIIALEYHYWRMRRQMKGIIAPARR